jgi:hypothetical protein
MQRAVTSSIADWYMYMLHCAPLLCCLFAVAAGGTHVVEERHLPSIVTRHLKSQFGLPSVQAGTGKQMTGLRPMMGYYTTTTITTYHIILVQACIERNPKIVKATTEL